MAETGGIHSFDHIVVRLKDLDAGVAAYTKLFPAGPRASISPTAHAAANAMGMSMAIFDLPNGGYIELVAPTPTPTTPTTPAPPNILRTELEKWGAGMSMVALQCNGVAATVAMLKRNKVRVLDADPAHVMVHPSSTHGVLLQLVEKHRTRAQLDAAAADTPGHVRDTSGLEGRIVSFKCIILYVQSVEQAVQSYQKLGLKLTARTSNTAGGFAQAFFFLKGGGLIEIVGPNDNVANKATADFARYMAKRGDGFKYLTLDGSAGCVDALHAAGVKTRETDRTHSDVHKSATLTKETLLQLNPVGMGTKREVLLKAKSSSKL